MILDNSQTVQLGTDLQPPKAKTRFISLDAEHSAELLCSNSGRYGNGYLIEKEHFSAISCPRGTDEKQWKRNNKHVENWLDEHPLAQRLSGHPSLAFVSKVAVWSCAIDGKCGNIGDNQALQSLFEMALFVAAIRQLDLDSRALQSQLIHHGQVLEFCLYDTSGTDNITSEIAENEKSILENAMALLRGKPDEIVRNLLCHATDKKLAALCENDFLTANTWSDEHQAELLEGRFRSVEREGQKFEIQAFQNRQNFLCKKTGQGFVILCGKAEANWLSDQNDEKSGLWKFVAHHSASSIQVVFGGIGDSVSEALHDLFRNRLVDTTRGRNLSFHEVDFETTEWGMLYKQGFRLISGNDWLLLASDKEAPPDVFTAMESPAKQKAFEEGLHRAVNYPARPPALPPKLQPQKWTVPCEPFLPPQNSPFTPKEIWTKFGIDPDRDKLVSLLIWDAYFLSPKSWRTLFAMLAVLKQRGHARVRVEACPREPTSCNCNLPAGGIEALRCSGWMMGGNLRNDAAKRVASWVCTRLGMDHVEIDYLSKSKGHDRWMDFTFETPTGRQKTGRIWFGKGFDFVNYPTNPKVLLFTPKALEDARYIGNTLISRKDVT